MVSDHDLSAAFLQAALDIGDARPERNVPSPSSGMKCTRQNWFKARGEPKTDQPDNGESVISAETGRLSEPLLSTILLAMKPPVVVSLRYEATDEEGRELTPEEAEALSLRGGQVDNIGVTPEGEEVLVEYKRKGIFAYLNLLRDGVLQGAEDDYMQMQALMKAKGLKRGLYIAANFDRSALTANTRKWETRPNGVFVEWVEAVPAAAEAFGERAAIQCSYIDGEDDPANVPRDYEPGDNRFPCTWCRWWQRCQEVG